MGNAHIINYPSQLEVRETDQNHRRELFLMIIAVTHTALEILILALATSPYSAFVQIFKSHSFLR